MSSEGRKNKVVNHAVGLSVLVVLISLVIWVMVQPSAFANPPQDTQRKIVSDDFTKNRQAASTTSSSKTSQGRASNRTIPRPRPRRTYLLRQ